MQVKSRLFVIAITLSGICLWNLFTGGTAKLRQRGKLYSRRKKAAEDTIMPIPGKKYVSSFSELEKKESFLSDSLFNLLAVKNKYNGSVLIAHDGKVLYSQTFGYTDYSTRELITDTSEFQLGSASKQFTAVSVMLLKERGKLNYSDLVTKYFPNFPYHKVTIQMLLAHRSGLPNYMFTCGAEIKDLDTLIDNMQVMDMLAKYKPECYFAPDKKFQYSNTNYCVLAAIVEKITYAPFADFLRNNIFIPLGMNHTHIYCKNDTVIPCKITGYNQNFSRSGTDFLDGVAGDKGIYSTTADLLKWDQALYGDKLIKQSTLQDAYIPYSRWTQGRSYGFGWHLMKLDNETVVYHAGWWHGFNCDFIRDIKHHYTIIALSNHVNWCVNRSYDLLALFHECEANTFSTIPANASQALNPKSNGKNSGN